MINIETELQQMLIDYNIDEQPSQSIIIECNHGTYTFKRNTYDHKLLGKFISRLAYNTIVNKASIIMGDALLKKKEYDSFTISLQTKILSLISCICLLFYVIFFFAADCSTKNNVVYFVFSVLFISAGVIITIYQSYSSYFRPMRVYLTLNEIIEKDLSEYFYEVNNTFNDNELIFKYNAESRSIICKVAIYKEQSEDKVINEEQIE